MKLLDEYIIPFAGLKPGIHSYRLQIDKTFFDYFDHGEIRAGQLSVKLELEKEERMLIFRFHISGEVTLPCDRCNEPVQLPVDGEERLIVKLGKEFTEQSDEVQIIPETESHFNTAPFLNESIHLLLPMRRIHPEDRSGRSTCDQEVLEKLENLGKHKEPDPRWDSLRELKNKQK